MNSNSEIKIIFEDEWLVVIDKPAGVVVNNAQTVHEETVQSWFEDRTPSLFSPPPNLGGGLGGEYYEKGGVVHRLDKETSGLLVLAKTPEAHYALKKQFLERKVQKKYSAVVHGVMEPPEGMLSTPIVRHPKIWGKFSVGGDLSRTAVTEWKRVMSYESGVMGREKYSLLELRPMTGRTHQLRVHLKYLGHPVVSDPLYLGHRQLTADLEWCPRMWLHAQELKFRHPVTGEEMDMTCPLPTSLQQALEKLVH